MIFSVVAVDSKSLAFDLCTFCDELTNMWHGANFDRSHRFRFFLTSSVDWLIFVLIVRREKYRFFLLMCSIRLFAERNLCKASRDAHSKWVLFSNMPITSSASKTRKCQIILHYLQRIFTSFTSIDWLRSLACSLLRSHSAPLLL